MSVEEFGVGKLPIHVLQSLLERYGGWDERLVVGPQIGEDAAVLDFGDRYLVAKSDPITFATDEIGRFRRVERIPILGQRRRRERGPGSDRHDERAASGRCNLAGGG